jgi:hypothetical protein
MHRDRLIDQLWPDLTIAEAAPACTHFAGEQSGQSWVAAARACSHRVIDRATGELLRELTLDEARTYQPSRGV